MRKLQYLSAFVLMAMCTMASAQNSVTIKGHVKFIDDDFKVKVYQRNGTDKVVLAETTVDPTTNNYVLNVPVEKPGQAILDCGQWQSLNVWLEDENMDVDFRGKDTARIKIKNPPYVYIKSGKKNEVMNWLNLQAYRSYQQMIAISQVVYRANLDNRQKQDSITGPLYMANNDNDDAYYRYLVEHYADRSSVMAAIGHLSYDNDKALIDEAFKTLIATDSKNQALVDAYIKSYNDKKARQERMKEGNPVPELVFENVKGKTKKLSDYKGKVLVLDFWASWCGPCRAEVPNLKKYYAEFDKKKVEFLSVSIDAKKDAWTKALAEEGMEWQQGWTPDAGKVAMDDFQFSGIPFILVIDKDGKIYRKHVRGENIQKGVQDCLDGKPSAPAKTTSFSMGAAMM